MLAVYDSQNKLTRQLNESALTTSTRIQNLFPHISHSDFLRTNYYELELSNLTRQSNAC